MPDGDVNLDLNYRKHQNDEKWMWIVNLLAFDTKIALIHDHKLLTIFMQIIFE